MTLLELRAKIDVAIAEFGGTTKVEVRDDEGDSLSAESVLVWSDGTKAVMNISTAMPDEILPRKNERLL